MRFLYPAEINGSTLTSSTVPETDYAAWDAGTPYSALNRRIYNHAIYEALTGSIGAQPDISPLAWLLVGPTNRWAMFDLTRGTRTTNASEITVELLLNGVDSLSLLDVTGAAILIEVRTSAGTLVYSRTATLAGLSSIYLADLPPSAAAVIKVSVTGTGTVSVGALQLGALFEMGETLFGLGLGITDYSIKSVDAFGETTLVKRNFSRRMSANVRVPKALVDACVTRLAGIRATPVVWIGSADYASTFVIGYYKDWNIDISYPLVSDCSLTIEGLAESDDFTFEDVSGGGGSGGGAGGIGTIGYSGGVSTTGGVITAPAGGPFLLQFNSGLNAFDLGLPDNTQPLPTLVNDGSEATGVFVLRNAEFGYSWVPYVGPSINISPTAMTSYPDGDGNWFLSEASIIAFGPSGDIPLPRLIGGIAGNSLSGGGPYQMSPGSLTAGSGFTYSFNWGSLINTLPIGNEWGSITPQIGASVGIPFIDNTGAGDVLVFGFEAHSVFNPSGTLPAVNRYFIRLVNANMTVTILGLGFDTNSHTVDLTISADQSLASLYVDGLIADTLSLPVLPPPARAIYVSAGMSWPSFLETGGPIGPTAGIDNIHVQYGIVV